MLESGGCYGVLARSDVKGELPVLCTEGYFLIRSGAFDLVGGSRYNSERYG